LQLRRTKRFVKDYAALPEELRERTEKALYSLLKDPHYPSLKIKKMEGRQGIWELRVSDSYRLTFQVSEDTYILRRVGIHDVLKKP
jgi:mRNA-degrading endonuclease RelE of RelBE toxin-antitoxin system